MKCPSCGSDNASNLKFCGECGTRLEATPAPVTCACGFVNAPGTKFCGQCGTRLATGTGPGRAPAGISLVGAAPTGAGGGPSAGAAALPSPGAVIAGQFAIETRLGLGGMGAVFRARDTQLDRPVALKFLLGFSPDALARFRREAKTLARLEHKHIVSVHQFVESDFGPCLVMQFVPGESLLDRIERAGKLDLAAAAQIAVQVLDGLAYAHRQGVIHRDIKPSNILLAKSGEVKIVDFGIARGVGAATLEQIGTPGYMAPEQEEGGLVDYRSDLYAVGMVLYHMLTGERPRVLRLEKLPAAIRPVIERATATALAERYETARELGAALAGLARVRAERSVAATPAPPPAPVPPPREPPSPAAEPEAGPPAALAPLPANSQGYAEFRAGRDGSVLIRIPAGEFVMGSERGLDAEKPVHRVWLDGYLIGKHEVTNAQYRAFCRATGHPVPPEPEAHWGYRGYFVDPRYEAFPVVGVSWQDAQAYCRWAGLRLPTEAEWERAAAWDERAGRAREYPWGDDEPTPVRANFGKAAGGGEYTCAVAAHPAGASPCGALDMAGNVWEWCTDWFEAGEYARRGASARNPGGPASGPGRVLRGGSWLNHVRRPLRCALRFHARPDARYDHYGFRVAAAEVAP